AIDSGCKTVILPTSAAAEITDAVTLGATDIVRDIQIYIAPDLASAFAIATASPPYSAASTEFLLVQALTKSGRISSSEAISRLRVVASSAPGNLSAQLLVAAASGTLPKQLSPRTSAAKIRILANRLMAPIDPGRGYPHPMQYQATTLEAIRSALTRHRPMLAPETRRAADATTDLATLLGKYLHTFPRSRDGKQKMAIALKAATGDLVAKLAQLDKLSAPQTAP
ncbi:MAG: hypothetical protein P8J87_12300, partial [Verrucomicrobiales bacterium]|nr:hypothetical protein [Verrucomicrobiales bacterium]